MNTGAPWPGLDEAEWRVLKMQAKLHQWATADPDRRFDDLFNLVYDPAFLVVAWCQPSRRLAPAEPALLRFRTPASFHDATSGGRARPHIKHQRKKVLYNPDDPRYQSSTS